MRLIIVLCFLIAILGVGDAWKPRYWKMDSHGRWKTSRWSTSEERFAQGYNLGRGYNVAPGYYGYGGGYPYGGYWGKKK